MSSSISGNIISSEPIKDFLCVGAWVKGFGTIFDWNGVFKLYSDCNNLYAQVMGELFKGPETDNTSWQLCIAQFNKGRLIISCNDINTIHDMVNTSISYNSNLVQYGSLFSGDLDELLLSADVVLAEDWPVWPHLGFPYDFARYSFSIGYGTIGYPVLPTHPQMVLTNCTWGDGYRGKCIVLNGTNSCGELTTTARSPEAITVEMIVKFGVATDAYLLSGGGLTIRYVEGEFRFDVNGATNDTVALCQFEPTIGSWYRLTFVYDKTTKYVYVNGLLYGSVEDTGVITLTAGTQYIGCTTGPAGFFNGSIDYLAITDTKLMPYKRPLSKWVPGIQGFDERTEWTL